LSPSGAAAVRWRATASHSVSSSAGIPFCANTLRAHFHLRTPQRITGAGDSAEQRPTLGHRLLLQRRQVQSAFGGILSDGQRRVHSVTLRHGSHWVTSFISTTSASRTSFVRLPYISDQRGQ
jgi:hypothetical protein